MTTKNTVYQIVTNRIIEELEKGVIPWRKPWTGGEPMNFISKKPYRGINCLLLRLTEYCEPYFLTFNQVKNLGGSVKPGSKSQIIVFWNWVESKSERDAKGNPEKIAFLRYYRVFNLEQVSGIEYKTIKQPLNVFEKNERCEQMFSNYINRPKLMHEEQRAFYRKSEDLINMPQKESFSSSEGYYATLFHEMVHSTGHVSRLDREGVVGETSFGNEDYSKEELIAETGAAFLCAKTGIENITLENSVAYIQSWLTVLRKDSRFLIHAASQAQRAVDFIEGVQT